MRGMEGPPRPQGAMSRPLDESSPDERELVEQAKAFSPQAWDYIFHAYYRKLFRYAYARLQDREEAEEVAATVLMEAVRSIHNYTYRGRPLLAWLYRIARNTVSDRLQAERRRPPGLRSLAQRFLRRGGEERPQPPEEGQEASISGEPEDVIERLDLKEAMARLTPEQREVLVLHYFVGLTLPEVARLLGKHERAVYSLQARAIAALRRHLTSEMTTKSDE